jgi:hypothetical protein
MLKNVFPHWLALKHYMAREILDIFIRSTFA